MGTGSRRRTVDAKSYEAFLARIRGVLFDSESLTHSVRAGVGLSAMRERIDSLGGTFAVYGRPGEGTRVVVSIPPGNGTPAPRRL